MNNPLFIAIGVHNAQNMQILDGVLKGIDDLTSWAASNNYDVIRIDDRDQRVNVNRIREALTPIEEGAPSPALLLDRPRIVVYFCGHGLHAPQDQYWVLSAGPTQPRERISAVGFRDTLATYGPNQIAIISDACRSPSAVTGQGDCVVDAYAADVGYPQKDIFFSSREGAASFAVPAQVDKPAYCVFSETLFKALSAPDGDNIDKLYSKLGRQVVTSQSLADYLGNKVPQAALNAGKFQVPQCDAGFRPEKNDYVEFSDDTDLTVISTGQAGPTGSGTHSHSDTSNDSLYSDDESLRQYIGWVHANYKDIPKMNLPEVEATVYQKYLEELSQKRQQYRINQSRSEWRVPFVKDVQNFISNLDSNPFENKKYGPVLIVSENYPLLIGPTKYESYNGWLTPLPSSEQKIGNWFWEVLGFFQTNNSSVLIANSSGLYSPIPIYRDLWCALTFSHPTKQPDDLLVKGGVDLVAWGERFSSEIIGELQGAEALKGLSAGTLKSDDITLWAQNMRIYKHADPMLGIISAYLYNGIGDVDNIRRMCYYYYVHNQDVPFDIAILANLTLQRINGGGFFVNIPEVPAISGLYRNPNAANFTWERTPEATVRVAGVTPMLRAGWQHIRHSKFRIHQQCWELIDQMTESPVSTFSGDDIGNILIQAFKEF